MFVVFRTLFAVGSLCAAGLVAVDVFDAYDPRISIPPTAHGLVVAVITMLMVPWTVQKVAQYVVHNMLKDYGRWHDNLLQRQRERLHADLLADLPSLIRELFQEDAHRRRAAVLAVMKPEIEQAEQRVRELLDARVDELCEHIDQALGTAVRHVMMMSVPDSVPAQRNGRHPGDVASVIRIHQEG